MSILWCGGEHDSILTNCQFSTSPSFYDATYSRGAFTITTNSFLNSPVLASPKTSLWMHFFIYFSTYSQSGSYYPIFGFRDSLTSAWIGVGIGSLPRGFRFLSWDGASTFNTLFDSDTNLMVGGIRTATIDIQVSNYGSNGTINLFQNNLLLGSYTGDLTENGAVSLDQISFLSLSSSYFYGNISQMILADEDTRGMSLKTLAPNAAGDQNQWTGSYADVDDISLNDDDYIYTDAAAQNIQLGLTGMPTGTEKLVRQVKVTSRIAQPTGGLGIKQGVKTNGAIHLGSEITPSVGFEHYSEIFNQNPETTSDWTASDINALQIALQSQ